MAETFKGYKVYGPYLSKSENRNIAVLYTPEHRTTMSWARYLMCRKEDRWLTPKEEVDHINNNKLDDRLENLQILSQADNKRKSHPGKGPTEHGTLTALRHCKPPCPKCRETRNNYTREYMRKKRQEDPQYGR